MVPKEAVAGEKAVAKAKAEARVQVSASTSLTGHQMVTLFASPTMTLASDAARRIVGSNTFVEHVLINILSMPVGLEIEPLPQRLKGMGGETSDYPLLLFALYHY